MMQTMITRRSLCEKSPEGLIPLVGVFRGRSPLNGQNWNRTSDTRIFSPLLYHLSYLAKRKGEDTLTPLFFASQILEAYLFSDCKTIMSFMILTASAICKSPVIPSRGGESKESSVNISDFSPLRKA